METMETFGSATPGKTSTTETTGLFFLCNIFGVKSLKAKAVKRVFSPHEPTSTSDDSADVAQDEKSVAPTQLTEPFAGLAVSQAPFHLPSEFLFLEEKFPRERKSGTSVTRTKIAAAHVDIPTHAEAFPQKRYRSWDQVVTAAGTYVGSHRFRFRILSSQLVSKCKRSDAAEIPQDVKDWLKRYRCIHGVIQLCRGGGVRDAHVNLQFVKLALMWL
ncbi:hypothetical protein PI124_g20205 [Phytophthora idaei]|nr:hypothetical protein PI126_g19692 [Phytophthora idaei]KAG3234745.1 hypothetical protein PI124_g20205 [Phytophthora idaei]